MFTSGIFEVKALDYKEGLESHALVAKLAWK